MARLPQPGGDAGTWGDVLNEYLRIAHAADGTLKAGSVNGAAVKDNAIGNAKLQAGAVTPEKVKATNVAGNGNVLSFDGRSFSWVAQISGVTDHGVLTGLADDDHPQYHTDIRGDARYYTQAQIDTALVSKANSTHAHIISDVTDLQASLDMKYIKPSTGIPEVDLSSSVQTKLNAAASVSDATTTSKGVIQLAGDLGGTASSPTVPALANKVEVTDIRLSDMRVPTDGSVTDVKIAVGANIAQSKIAGLAAALDAKENISAKGQLNGYASLDSTGKVPSTQLPTTSIPDATATSKGVVQLAGDLGGTATAPTVPGLSTKANSADVVLLAGTQTITGPKDFTGGVTVSGTGIVVTNDTRLTDDRTPLNASVTTAKLNSIDVPVAGEYLTYNGTQFEWVPSPSGAVASVNTKTGAVVLNAADVSAIPSADKGVASGVATLGADGKVPAAQLPVSSATNRNEIFFHTGALSIKVGSHRLYNDTGVSWTISGIRVSVGGTPSGSSVIIDVNKNGATLFTTQASRPTIAATTNTSGKVTNMDINTVADGEYLTVDIDQVGSTVAGSDLTVQITVQ